MLFHVVNATIVVDFIIGPYAHQIIAISNNQFFYLFLTFLASFLCFGKGELVRVTVSFREWAWL
jgi:hypothetical protein